MQYLNEAVTVQSDKWVADTAFVMLMRRLNYRSSEKILTGFRIQKMVRTQDLIAIVSEEYNKAYENHLIFLKTGNLNHKIIESAVSLAKLDLYYRSGIIDTSFEKADKKDLEDLKNLVALVNPKTFKANRFCCLNPTFGEASKLVGGADADCIIDDTLVDLKVSQHLKLERSHLNQLIGYYVLSLIGGVDGCKKSVTIKKLGIYFARYGELWTVPISQLASPTTIKEFKRWITKYIELYKQPRLTFKLVDH